MLKRILFIVCFQLVFNSFATELPSDNFIVISYEEIENSIYEIIATGDGYIIIKKDDILYYVEV